MAGVDVGTAYLTVVPSAKGFAGKLQSELGGGMAAAGANAGGRASKGFGAKFKAGVATAAKAGALALVAAMGIGVKAVAGAVNAASDLQQSTGGVEAIFGKQAKGIKKSADAAALGLGLSKNSYQELAAALGAGLKNKGIEDFAGQSKALIGIGADLAAQFGGSTQEAVEAIGSAMRGESDPIERYGVSLNETAVNAELARKGQTKLKGAALDQAKALARVSIITKQTKDAQGAFGREGDTLAGKQARLKATWENMRADLGAKFLPTLTRLSGWFLEKGLPAVQRFGGWLTGKLWPALQQGYRTILPGVQEALSILTGGVDSGSVSWKKIGDVVTQKVIPFLAQLFRVYLPAMATQWRAVIEVVKAVWRVFETLMKVVSKVVTFILRRFADMTDMWSGVLRALSKVPGFGWAKDAADKLEGASRKARGLAQAIDNIDRNVNIDVNLRPQQGRIRVGGQSLNVGLRAEGGPVTKGRPYIVGERRPELFVPDESGTIIPRVPDARSSFGGTGKTDLSDATLIRLAQILHATPLQAQFNNGQLQSAMAVGL